LVCFKVFIVDQQGTILGPTTELSAEENLYLRRRLHLFECKFKRDGDGRWTQKDWADLWGYANLSSVSRIFNGHSPIQDDKIHITCKKAGIKAEFFYTEPISSTRGTPCAKGKNGSIRTI